MFADFSRPNKTHDQNVIETADYNTAIQHYYDDSVTAACEQIP